MFRVVDRLSGCRYGIRFGLRLSERYTVAALVDKTIFWSTKIIVLSPSRIVGPTRKVRHCEGCNGDSKQALEDDARKVVGDWKHSVSYRFEMEKIGAELAGCRKSFLRLNYSQADWLGWVVRLARLRRDVLVRQITYSMVISEVDSNKV
jgi:hypothetical protein